MYALFDRFYNFILPLLRGEDHVCACICGRHQVHHVVPYNGDYSAMDSREINDVSDIVTRQEMNVMVGLVLGLCISLFLQWLDTVRLKYWKENQMNDVGFWSWRPKFTWNTRKLFMQTHPQHTEDSREMLNSTQDLCNSYNGSFIMEPVPNQGQLHALDFALQKTLPEGLRHYCEILKSHVDPIGRDSCLIQS